MAVGTPALVTPVVGAATTTVTTASFTPVAGDLLVMMAAARGASAVMPTISDSLGETWTPFSAGSSMAVMESRMWWKIATATAQTVTAVSTGALQTAVVIVKVSGASTDFSNYKVDSHATTTTRAVTMDAFATGSICLYFVNASAGGTWAQPTGYVEVTDAVPATNLRVVWGYDTSSPATTISSLGAGVDSTMWGLEIKPPTGGGAPTGGLKVWSGSAWVEKPAKVWSGSAWVAKPVKIWSGSAWVVKPSVGGGSGEPVYADNFNRADANLEASTTASGGWAWTHDGLIAGAFAITSNQLRCTTTSATGSVYMTPALNSDNHYVEYRVPSITVNAGPFACCRLQDVNNFVGIRHGLADVHVYRRNAGTLTSLYTLPTGAAVGDVLRLEVSGLDYLVYKNGTVIKTAAAIGGTAITVNTAGLVARGLVGTHFDDFQAG